jgi:uncharacterized membrane protein YqiK
MNEEMNSMNNDQEIKIESLKRELASRNQEIESMKQVRDMEIKNSKRNFDRQIKDRNEEIVKLDI